AGIYQHENAKRVSYLADIDAAVLSDELPLSAYLDHGFNAFLAEKGQYDDAQDHRHSFEGFRPPLAHSAGAGGAGRWIELRLD
ncbi:DUF3619 family protein, partial [Acinetobacter baumannii]